MMMLMVWMWMWMGMSMWMMCSAVRWWSTRCFLHGCPGTLFSDRRRGVWPAPSLAQECTTAVWPFCYMSAAACLLPTPSMFGDTRGVPMRRRLPTWMVWVHQFWSPPFGCMFSWKRTSIHDSHIMMQHPVRASNFRCMDIYCIHIFYLVYDIQQMLLLFTETLNETPNEWLSIYLCILYIFGTMLAKECINLWDPVTAFVRSPFTQFFKSLCEAI